MCVVSLPSTMKASEAYMKKMALGLLYNSPLERNLNLVLRYGPIVKMLKKIGRKSRNELRILEIGSGSIGITRFYSGKVVGIDIEAEKYNNPRLKFLKGSATKLPFKDKSFDIVISVDTLEHLARKEQIRMVQEAFRVAKKYILFTYPVGFTKYHERILKTWKKSHLTKSLEEHLHGGTPKGDEVQRALKGKKYGLLKEYGTHPALAYYFNYLEQNIITKAISRTILKAFLPLFRIPKGNTRVYFFVTKN